MDVCFKVSSLAVWHTAGDRDTEYHHPARISLAQLIQKPWMRMGRIAPSPTHCHAMHKPDDIAALWWIVSRHRTRSSSYMQLCECVCVIGSKKNVRRLALEFRFFGFVALTNPPTSG